MHEKSLKWKIISLVTMETLSKWLLHNINKKNCRSNISLIQNSVLYSGLNGWLAVAFDLTELTCFHLVDFLMWFALGSQQHQNFKGSYIFFRHHNFQKNQLVCLKHRNRKTTWGKGKHVCVSDVYLRHSSPENSRASKCMSFQPSTCLTF